MSFDPRTEYQDIDTAQGYDHKRFSSLSGRVFQWCERRVLAGIAKKLPPGALVMDAPCGTGRLSILYLSNGCATLAADISGEMIQVARRRTASWNGRVHFGRMDFAHLPLVDRSVDAVFSIRFLVHFSPLERIGMLREFRRVSRGPIVISMSLSSPWMVFRRRVKEWLGHEKPVRHPVTLEQLGRELRDAGLKQIRWLWTLPFVSEQILVVCEPDDLAVPTHRAAAEYAKSG